MVPGANGPVYSDVSIHVEGMAGGGVGIGPMGPVVDDRRGVRWATFGALAAAKRVQMDATGNPAGNPSVGTPHTGARADGRCTVAASATPKEAADPALGREEPHAGCRFGTLNFVVASC